MPLEDQGYLVERFPVLRTRLIQRVKQLVGPALDASDGSLVGQMKALLALRLALSVEKIEQMIEVRNPDAASGDVLVSLVKMAGLLGREDGETDGRLRVRREAHLASFGQVSFNALYDALVSIDSVFDAHVRYHQSTTGVLGAGFDGAGEIEVSILSSDDSSVYGDDVAAALLKHLLLGVKVDTNFTVVALTATDSAGNDHVYNTTIPDSPFDVSLDISVTTNADYPSDGDAQVKVAALPRDPVALHETEDSVHVTRFGYPVILADITCRILETVSGITGITVLASEVGSTEAPFDIDIPENNVASYDILNMTVTSS